MFKLLSKFQGLFFMVIHYGLIFRRWVVSPMLNPQPGGPGCLFWSDSYLTKICLAKEDLLVAKLPPAVLSMLSNHQSHLPRPGKETFIGCNVVSPIKKSGVMVFICSISLRCNCYWRQATRRCRTDHSQAVCCADKDMGPHRGQARWVFSFQLSKLVIIIRNKAVVSETKWNNRIRYFPIVTIFKM